MEYTANNGEQYYVPPAPTPTVYPPVITTVSLPNGALSTAYNTTLAVTNGTAPYTFAITAGALPAGLTLSTAGVIFGIPTSTGTANFVVTVTDSEGSPKSGSAALSISVPSVPSIATPSLPAGTVGIPYFASLSGTGGAAPYGFQVTAGSLPSGLTLATTGGLTGTPTTAGSFTVTVQIYDSGSPQGVATTVYTLVVQPASTVDDVTAIDECVILGGSDGGLYVIVPGQRHDTDYSGNPEGFLQRWSGVPNSSTKMQLLQLGGATISAKGEGYLNVSATDGSGRTTKLSNERRPMILDDTNEVKRDFMAKAVPKDERFGLVLDNGGVVDAWFEAHTGILWVRPFFTGRKA